MQLRLVTNEEMEQAIKLSDETFRDHEHTSMGRAFPAIFNPGIGHSYGAFDGDRLVSFMGFVPEVIRVGEAKLHVFSMGSVCTHPDYRGRGIAGQLLDLCKQHAKSAGASLIFISGGRSLYTRADCYHFGQTHTYTMDKSAAERLMLDGLDVRPMDPVDLLGIKKVADRRTVAFEQSITDLQYLLDAAAFASIFKFKHRVFVAAGQDGEIEAYAIIAAPGAYESSRKPTLIEWGGPADQVAALLGESMKELSISELNVTIGWQEQELIDILEKAGLSGAVNDNSGTVYLVDEQQLFKQISPYMPSALEAWGEASRQLADGAEESAATLATSKLSPGDQIGLLFNPRYSHAHAYLGIPTIPLPYLCGLNYI